MPTKGPWPPRSKGPYIVPPPILIHPDVVFSWIGSNQLIDLELLALSENENVVTPAGEEPLVHTRTVRLLPDHCRDEVLPPERFVRYCPQIRLLTVIAVHPHRTVGRKQCLDLRETVAHHRQPDRVLELVVIVQEGLLPVERRVEVCQLDFPHVLVRELRQFDQARQGVECVTPDQQIVLSALLVRRNLSDSARIKLKQLYPSHQT